MHDEFRKRVRADFAEKFAQPYEISSEEDRSEPNRLDRAMMLGSDLEFILTVLDLAIARNHELGISQTRRNALQGVRNMIYAVVTGKKDAMTIIKMLGGDL